MNYNNNSNFNNNSEGNIDLEKLKNLSEMKGSEFIPCLFLKYAKGSSKIFLYFHANAEDLGRTYKFLTYIHLYLKMHVIAVEYPGYGVYEGDSANADKVIKDADIVYKFLIDELNWIE